MGAGPLGRRAYKCRLGRRTWATYLLRGENASVEVQKVVYGDCWVVGSDVVADAHGVRAAETRCRRAHGGHAVGLEDPRARRREVERNRLYATCPKAAVAGHLYVYAVHRRFLHRPGRVLRKARLCVRAGGCARAREFRRRIRTVCKRRPRWLRRCGMACKAALLQWQSDDVGRLVCGIRSVDRAGGVSTASSDDCSRGGSAPRR